MISPSAAICPGCGHDHKKDRDDKSNLIQIFAILCLLLIFVALGKMGWLDDIFDFIVSFVKSN
jgi:hypothetical protein